MSKEKKQRGSKTPPPPFKGYIPAGKGDDYPRYGMTPEQGCLGCSATIAVLTVTVAIWAFIYWYNEPDFHPKPAPPPTQSQLRTKPSESKP